MMARKMSDTESKKMFWPELEGVPSELAKQKILADRPDVKVEVLPFGTFVTQEYNTERIRVFYDTAGNVKGVPMIG